MEKKTLSNTNAGLILFMVMAVYTLILNLSNLQSNSALSWLSYLIVIGGISIFVIRYAKDREGNVTFGNLFGYGFKICAILTVFYIVFMVLFYLIFPEYKEQLLEVATQKAIERAKGDDTENVLKGMEMFKRFFWVGLIAGIMFSFALLGAIGSLIGAALSKKNPNTFQRDINQIGS